MDWHREFSCCPCAQDVKKFVEEIKAAGGHAELYLYQGEGHAFMNAKPDSLERMQSAPLHCPYPAPVLHVQIPVASLMQGPTLPNEPISASLRSSKVYAHEMSSSPIQVLPCSCWHPRGSQ